MPYRDTIAQQPTDQACAKETWIKRGLSALRQKWKHRKHPGLGQINSHLARDIGLSDADLARAQHKWPSQTTHPPRR